jgi:hypothetical protein
MPFRKAVGCALLLALAVAPDANAQTKPFGRLPQAVFDVTPPSARVTGSPGTMAVRQGQCRSVPPAMVRRRIVDVAVQEWAFFGFSIVDQMAAEDDDDDDRDRNDDADRQRRGRRRVDPVEAARVASSIAGYWSATPEGTWIVGRQNEAWNDEDGLASRWRYPWSAAFISWVMCEGGLDTAAEFQRAVAHHTYIDQAIRARDGRSAQGAFVAYDAGETAIEPGDLLCSARRPVYRTLADRRRQLGVGARTHCDVVVKVDTADGRLLAIGGNVRGAVSLKLLPLERQGSARFAHLKLRAPSIGADALDRSPTMQALGCADFGVPTQLASADIAVPPRCQMASAGQSGR